jgi:hypothetical protein
MLFESHKPAQLRLEPNSSTLILGNSIMLRFILLCTLSVTGVSGNFNQCIPSEPCCNGLANLCDIPVNEILFGMVHNSMSSPSAGFLIFANHLNDPYVDALDAGYRGLSLDLCNCNGNFVFCHGGDAVGCGIGRRDPVTTFGELNDWLDQNPTELVVIYLEINEAADEAIELSDVETILEAVPNQFADKLYQHNTGEDWPLMQDLLGDGKQVILFYIRGPNGNGMHPPGIHYFFDSAMETEYSYATVEELRTDILNGCPIDRGAGSTRDWLMMNNFVTRNTPFGQAAPSRDAAQEINTIEFATGLLTECESVHNKQVNIIAVDFWKSGNLPELVQLHNSALQSSISLPPTSPPPTISTAAPSAKPTLSPTRMLTPSPTSIPTASPTSMPSTLPSSSPSQAQRNLPSAMPSIIPSDTPSIIPSDMPSVLPSDGPSSSPSSLRTTSAVPSSKAASSSPSRNGDMDESSAPSSADAGKGLLGLVLVLFAEVLLLA